MVNFTITWVLRFAAGRFFAGLALVAFSAYMLLVAAPAVEAEPASAVMTPAVFAFGNTAWYLALALGAALLMHAWHVGAQARHGDL